MKQDNTNTPKTEPNVGNASNPSPEDPNFQQTGKSLLGEKAEKYIREVASPEDYPDAKDEEESTESEDQ